ncbi:bacC [Symbiodinium sp. KB8]|nr:bacC [Symbiodinium sp. KB8]
MLALEGASVYFCSLCEAEGDAVAAAINEQLGLERAFHTRVDVSEREALAVWINSVGEKEGRVDILVPNAAAFVFGTIDEVDDDDWDKVLGVNVKGYANCVKLTVPWMRKAGAGSVVMTASVSSHIAQPAFVPYNTSKGAILQMSRCLAMDLGPENIRVNAVCPGTIDTPATAKHATKLGVSKAELVEKTVEAHFLKRLGSTKDCAQATLFLASDESSFITGTHLMVDGGYTAH